MACYIRAAFPLGSFYRLTQRTRHQRSAIQGHAPKAMLEEALHLSWFCKNLSH